VETRTTGSAPAEHSNANRLSPSWGGAPESTVKVWDVVVRLFHWSTVSLFALAYLFESPRDLHTFLGYALMAVLAVRILWGFVGSEHARFWNFVPSPTGFLVYMSNIVRGREARFLGHNPAGGAMIVALMGILVGIGVSGWMMGLDAYFGQDWVEELHETLVNVALVLIALHVAGVALASLRHRENLVKAMFTGVKRID